jgi:ElaB/YqjD/DUF883 family membrane-anchored ribosome-binding protein
MPDQSSAATEHAIIQEITQPLAELPDDSLATIRADFPTALRGYERFAVEEYVRQTRHLVAELQATRSPEAAVRRALERVGEQISGILQRAHDTAEQITAQSRSEAEDRLEQARTEARQIADAAEQRVRELDADTDRIWMERQRIVADAEDLASQLVGLARTAAERFPADDAAVADADAGPDAETDTDAEPQIAAESGEQPTALFGAAIAPAPAASPESAAAVAPESEPVSDSDAESGEDPADESGDQPDPRARQSEVERTMAFRPLTPDDTEPQAAAQTGEPGGQRPPLRGGSGGVIPPASQAASERFRQ